MVYSAIGENLATSESGVWVHNLESQTQKRRIFLRGGFPIWFHDGQKVVITVPMDNQPGKLETWRVDRDGTDLAKLPVPETLLVLDCSHDGNWLAARSEGGELPNYRGQLTLIHPDGTGSRWLTDGTAKSDVLTTFKVSPDGQSVAYAEMTTEGNVSKARFYVIDTDGRQRREIPIKFEPDTLVTMQWSPDGARFALELMNRQRRDASLALVNLDGSNYRILSLPPGTWNLHVCDWQVLTSGLRCPSQRRWRSLRKQGRLTRPGVASARCSRTRPHDEGLHRGTTESKDCRRARSRSLGRNTPNHGLTPAASWRSPTQLQTTRPRPTPWSGSSSGASTVPISLMPSTCSQRIMRRTGWWAMRP